MKVQDKPLLVGLRVVDEAAEFIEPLLAQAVKDDIDRRALFADKEHPLSARHIVGDKIGDGLRLPRAGRTLDNVAATRAGQRHRGGLGGITWHHRPFVGPRESGAGFVVEGARIEREDAIKRFTRQFVIKQRAVVAHERHLPIIEVADGERAEVEVP